MLDGFGVLCVVYDDIVSFGDVIWDILVVQGEKMLLYIGFNWDQLFYYNLKVIFISDDEVVEVISCIGLFDDEMEILDDYCECLQKFVDCKFQMICVNLDIVVECGDKLVWCVGVFVWFYEDLGGDVVIFGKFYVLIYEVGLKWLEKLVGCFVLKEEVLVIGDGFLIDICGVVLQDIDVLFIIVGIYVLDFGLVDVFDEQFICCCFIEEGLCVWVVILWLWW